LRNTPCKNIASKKKLLHKTVQWVGQTDSAVTITQ
jgi:hypothetical protein